MSNVPKQLNIIIDREFADKVSKLGASCGAVYKTITICKGTASSRRLDALGLGETEKALVVFIATDDIVQNIIEVLRADFKIAKDGHGIAFAIPLSGAVGEATSTMLKGRGKRTRRNLFRASFLEKFGSKRFSKTKEYEITRHIQNRRQGVEKKMEIQYELIITILNRGYAEIAMQAAKKAGAQGGTIIKARGTKENDEAEFLGVPIQPEKDALYILSRQSEKNEIMQAIVSAAGLSQEGRGLCYSLPVSDVVGINRLTSN